MKSKKNRVANFLKMGILFLGITLLLWNCESETLTEEQTIENTSNSLFTEFQNQFNKKDFENTISYKYKVDWTNSTKQFSEDLQSNFYEFDLIYSDTFNPKNLNKISPKKYNIAFKLVVIENQENSYDFYIAKFHQDKEENISIESLRPTLNKNSGYKGVTHLYDKNDDIIFAKFITKKEDNNLEKYIAPTLRNGGDNTMQRYVTTCETVTVHHYIDWYYHEYDDWGNLVNSYYSHTTYAGSSTTQECTTTWVPHPYDYGQGGLFGTGVGCDETGECVEDVEDALLDDQITSDLTGKAACLLAKLKETSTGFVNAIKKFDGEFSVAHLHLTLNNNLPTGNYGVTNPPVNYTINIELSNTQLSNISDLGGAVALAHEVIHAEIFRKMLSAAQQGDLNAGQYTTQNRISYINSLRNNFPGIYDYYIERYRPTWNHNLIAQHYTSTIADIVEEFDNNSLSRQVYEDIAWAGLRIINNPVTNGTETSIAWDNLSPVEKSRVTSNLSNYFQNGTKNCN